MVNSNTTCLFSMSSVHLYLHFGLFPSRVELWSANAQNMSEKLERELNEGAIEFIYIQ